MPIDVAAIPIHSMGQEGLKKMRWIRVAPLLLFVSALAAQTANLSISEIGAPNPVSAGALLTYTLTVTNAGPDTAVNVDVTAAYGKNIGFCCS